MIIPILLSTPQEQQQQGISRLFIHCLMLSSLFTTSSSCLLGRRTSSSTLLLLSHLHHSSFKPPSLKFLFSSSSSSIPNQNKNKNPNLKMSAKRTVADVLMANARANAQKKTRPGGSSSSPVKPKTLEQPPQQQDGGPSSKKEEKEEEAAVQSLNLTLNLKEEKVSPLKRKASDFSPKKLLLLPKTLELDAKSSPPKKSNSSPPPPPKKGKKEDVQAIDLDERIGQLKKKASDFKPESAAYWKEGEPVPFLFLARGLDLIANESSRIIITEILSNVFRTVIATTPGDLIAVVYLAANKIAPSHEGVELGIGDTSIIRALASAYGRKEEHIKNQLKTLGDLGLVAKASRSSQSVMFKPPPLTVVKVLDTFRVIAKESGKDSQDKKRNHIKGLLVAASDCEPQYLIRLLQSKLRIGLAEQTLLVALAQAAVYSERRSAPPSQLQPSIEEATKIVKQVYSVLPNYDKVVAALLNDGVWKLSETCSFTPGVPIGPMLAKPTKGVSEILDKFQDTEFTCEYKYDGERAQIHYMDDGSVEIYSRNAERNTVKYPDVVQSVKSFRKSSVRSFVLDCEVVAYDRLTNKILSFQILSTRARKEVEIDEIKVKVCIFAFDILYLNGQSLLQEQLKVRREHLYASFKEIPGEFQFATAITSNDLEEIQKFLEAAVNDSCEGLIVKTLNKEATYEPAKRSNNWLKLKKDYMDSVGDSLDLVPIAAFHGRGKRTGVYGAFLLACYNDNDEEYQSICKIGTGFSEVMLEERSTSLRSKVIPNPKPYYRYSDTINPDVWFEPTEVWEVKAADLSISPVHHAATGIVDPNKGISLRFPRLLRVREDKSPDQATSSEQVAEMYRAQKINHTNNQDEVNDD